MSDPHPFAADYLKTIITVHEDGTVVAAHRSTLLESGPYHVLTAWNPGAERPGEAANRAAHVRLHARLVAHGGVPRFSVGRDPDSSHHEEGWAVGGLDDATVCAIGREFGQVAVFRITADTQAVLDCDGGWRVERPLG